MMLPIDFAADDAPYEDAPVTISAIYPSAWLTGLAALMLAVPTPGLTAEDSLAPIKRKQAGRLVSEGAMRHTVAKPAYPVWEDASRLVSDRNAAPLSAASSTARRRTAFQNPPDPLNLRGLSEGFREGTRPLTEAGQQAGEWIESQARGAAEGTRRLVDQTGENLRRGTQSALNGTADTLEQALPRSTRPYAQRTQYDEFGRPTLADDSDFGTTDAGYEAAQLRDAQERADQQRYEEQLRARQQSEANSLADQQRAYQDRLDWEARQRSEQGRGVVERFAEDTERFAAPRSQLPPVPRTNPSTAATRREAWQPFGEAAEQDYPPPRTTPGFTSNSGQFPALPPAADWDTNLTRGQSPNSGNGFGTQQPSRTGTSPPPAGGSNETGWTGLDGTPPPAGGTRTDSFAGSDTNRRDDNAIDLDRFLLVVLGAASCFTWLAYYDVRQKYRMALRGVQVSDFGTHSTAA